MLNDFNQNLDDYLINWIEQLVTTDEMNAQLFQLLNNITYLTDSLVPCIIYGAQVSYNSTQFKTTITAGVFRSLDQTVSDWNTPYNVTPLFFKCPSFTATPSASAYIVARPSINTTDPNYQIVTGSYQYVLTPLANDVVIGRSSVYDSYLILNYNGIRSNDLNYIFASTQTSTVTGSSPISLTPGQTILLQSNDSSYTFLLPNNIYQDSGTYPITIINMTKYASTIYKSDNIGITTTIMGNNYVQVPPYSTLKLSCVFVQGILTWYVI